MYPSISSRKCAPCQNTLNARKGITTYFHIGCFGVHRGVRQNTLKARKGITAKKSTTGTVVFEAAAGNAAVPMIHIKKHAVPAANDEAALEKMTMTITLTIEME